MIENKHKERYAVVDAEGLLKEWFISESQVNIYFGRASKGLVCFTQKSNDTRVLVIKFILH